MHLPLCRTASRCRRAYILPLFFFFSPSSFFRRLIFEVTERIPTSLGHIFTYDCYLKNFVRTLRALTPHGLGQKNDFGADYELRPNISLQRNTVSTIGKKLVNLQELPYMPPNLVNFGPETAENGWRVFVQLPKFFH